MDNAARTVNVIVAKSNRLDKAVAALLPEISRSAAQKLIDQGRVFVNGTSRDASFRVQPRDSIVVHLPERPSGTPQAEAITLDVIYEDGDVIAVNKPAGMVIHPAAGNASGTLVNAMLAYAPDVATVGDERRPGIVHRLDKETSGVLLVAKREAAYRALQAQFKSRAIEKTYLALCVGKVAPAHGLIHKPIARDPGDRKRMAVVSGGRDAVTAYSVTEVFRRESADYGARYSLVRAQPRTGRTHQLRVHFASIGFPIVGDALYGARKDPLTEQLAPRQLLHASGLSFASPSSGGMIKLHVPLPEDMRRVLEALTQ